MFNIIKLLRKEGRGEEVKKKLIIVFKNLTCFKPLHAVYRNLLDYAVDGLSDVRTFV